MTSFQRLAQSCVQRLREGSRDCFECFQSWLGAREACRHLMRLSPLQACQAWARRPFDLQTPTDTSFEIDPAMRHGLRLIAVDMGENPYPVIERVPFFEALLATLENRAPFMEAPELALVEDFIGRMRAGELARELDHASALAQATKRPRRL